MGENGQGFPATTALFDVVPLGFQQSDKHVPNTIVVIKNEDAREHIGLSITAGSHTSEGEWRSLIKSCQP